MVVLPFVLPVAFVAFITNAHTDDDATAVPVNETKVAVPMEEVNGATVVPLMVYVLVTEPPVPPDQETVNPVNVIADVAMLVIGVGITYTVVLPMALPDAFVAVMTNGHDCAAVNEVNVAVPVDDEDGVAVVPLMVYEVVTDVPAPPDQETVNPVVVMDEGVMLVIGVGNASTVVVPVVPLPDVFVGVITKNQDVPVNEVNVAVPVDDEDGVAVVPLMVYVFVTDVPVPPDQVTVNPLVVMADGVTPVTGVGSASTVVVVPTALPDAFDAVIINAQDVPANEVNVAVPVKNEEGVVGVPLMVYVFVTAVPIPPDQVTVNPVVLMADGVILVTVEDGLATLPLMV